MMMMGLDSKMGFSEGLVMMMMIKGLDDDDGKIGYWLSYEIDYVHRFDEDHDEKDFFSSGLVCCLWWRLWRSGWKEKEEDE